MADAQAAALTCRAVAERHEHVPLGRAARPEERTGIRLEPIVRRERGVVAPGRRAVSAVCPGCGCRWVPATPETRCSLCTARR